MTVREAVEKTVDSKKADLITINCDDYRKCSSRSVDSFIKQYKGTDVWHGEAEDNRWEENQFGQLILTITLPRKITKGN